ncbi:3,5-dihydroxyphenylacetyl-CoA synthase DpgA [Lentzea sp.]|uniref:3,5-dihydroxyphenylacetyl-CoA synthase DpgA n=1 Tax=Lentzea sp. TaxID=56099 RepID=UPI002C7C4CED|nr:3,5-dihydroxyphenylacetyl-CoA synthase DpgA [Lentzea sp.]HUQ54782.1 3,5-dihydroxyphenylacetyl-CoA synthase DpgA [Lentzea sp.]
MTTQVETRAATAARIVGVGTSVPDTSYTQRQILDIFRIDDPKIRSVFMNSAIDRRYLTLPAETPAGRAVESQGQLLAKHREQGIEMAARALQACLKDAEADLTDVAHLCCVSSTGFLTPGFTALLIRKLGLPPAMSRLDVVGMGCNAGLNALNSVNGWASTHAGKLAVMICVEACSAAYVFDGTMRSSVVNSLFGDGAAAIAVTAEQEPTRSGPEILKFASCIIPEAVDAMRYDWDDSHGKFSFFLDREVPYVVGANVEDVIGRLLVGTEVRRSDVKHWIIHSGGKKVIDSVMINLGLTRHDVRHTTSILRDYGNVSSGSFLFSLERLLDEGRVEPGDYGVLMTMGPGSTIETALVRY